VSQGSRSSAGFQVLGPKLKDSNHSSHALHCIHVVTAQPLCGVLGPLVCHCAHQQSVTPCMLTAISNILITLCRSTGKVANLTIKATLSNCILHRRGRVTVEGCKLQCHAAGLEHLFTPLVTLAAAGLTKQLQQWPMVTGKEAGMGVLSVVETKIRVSRVS